MARQETASELINRTAVEVGIPRVSDPVSSQDGAFIQLTGLLSSAGQELVELHEWQALRQVINFTTSMGSLDTQLGDGVTVGTNGVYDLPANFGYMIDQTGWDQTNDWPMGGPQGPQLWTYLEGNAAAGDTIYAKFREVENKLELWPQPTSDGLNVSFEYISRYWVKTAGASMPDADFINNGTDVVLFEPILVVKFLKVKFLEAKGFDSRAARRELESIFDGRRGKDTGAPILNAAGGSSQYPYLHPWRNVGDTGFGV